MYDENFYDYFLCFFRRSFADIEEKSKEIVMTENYMPKYRASELDVTRELSRACFQVKLVVQKSPESEIFGNSSIFDDDDMLKRRFH